MRRAAFLAVVLCLAFCLSLGPETRAADGGADRTVEEIARLARGSVVTVNSSDRKGESRGLGSGFIVRSDGLIATNFHVIGEGRAFTIQLADGRSFVPTTVLAFDRAKDLALVEIEARDLPALELGDSEALRPGQPVLAVGNPLGLRLSVADGVVAERREIGGQQLIQVSMPIEPGSSGSPLIDRQGRAVGVIAMKSTGSLGFAVPINDLKALQARPHPVRMSRWLTIGALDPREWATLLGGQWRQRAGRLVASGWGEGFGGRMLCLSQAPPPPGKLELAVEVRLSDESGAAGLVFHSDGGHKHYGFYPTAGSLRLTRFEGPDVFTWNILETAASEHYRPGEWNALRVRVEGSRIYCSVNGRPVIEAADEGLAPGKVGLVKFREPGAEFRRFRVGAELPAEAIPAGDAAPILELGSRISPRGPPEKEVVEGLLPRAPAALQVLRDRARELEKEAFRLRHVADLVHRLRVERELRDLLRKKGEDADLLQAALLLSMLDNDELDPEPYRKLVDRIAAEVRQALPEGAAGRQKLEALVQHMFGELGFHGSRSDYYHRSNSYLNEVLDDREGIPITLSVVFLELARRIGLKAEGVGMPGHFLARVFLDGGEGQLIDVFEGGKAISRAEAEGLAGRPLAEGDLAAATRQGIIVRMLHNLLGVAEREGDTPGMLRYLDVIVALDEGAAVERWMRAVLRIQTAQPAAAVEDLDWLLEREPAGVDLERTRELREALRKKQL